MQGRAVVIVNPRATTTTPRVREDVRSALLPSLDVLDVLTEGRGHATELAAKAAADGVDVVVAVGGDGTINEVVNGLRADAPADARGDVLPALGIVPGGNTNVLARTLGLPRDPAGAIEALVQAVRSGSTRPIGLGRIADRWFTFSAGLGVDAEVVGAVEARRMQGARSTNGLWMRTAVRHVFMHTDRRTPSLTLEDPATGRSYRDLFVVIASNSTPWTYLRNRPIVVSPAASFDRGLEILALRSLAIVPTMWATAQMVGRPAGPGARSQVRLADVASVQVTAHRPVACQVDGEYVGTLERAALASVPCAIRVVIPHLADA